MKNYLILLCLILTMISCGKKSSIPELMGIPDDSQNPYTISSTHVGSITRGTNIHQLYSIFPAKQIKLIKNKGGFFNQEFDDYNVYDNNGKLLFIATPEVAGDTSSFINRIIIQNPGRNWAEFQFRTNTGCLSQHKLSPFLGRDRRFRSESQHQFLNQQSNSG